MKLTSRRRLTPIALILTLSALCGAEVRAQRLRDAQWDRTQVDVTQEAVLRITLDKAGAATWCGLRVDFGNGTGRDIRVGDKGDADLQLQVSYRYPNAGLYTVTVAGTRMVRGLKSAGACEGGDRTLQLRVTDSGGSVIQPSSMPTGGAAMPPMPPPPPPPGNSPAYPSPPAYPSAYPSAAPSNYPGPSAGGAPAPANPPYPSAYPSSGNAYPDTSSMSAASPYGATAPRMPGNSGDCGPNPSVECAGKALSDAVGKLREVFGRKKPNDPPAQGGSSGAPYPTSSYPGSAPDTPSASSGYGSSYPTPIPPPATANYPGAAYPSTAPNDPGTVAAIAAPAAPIKPLSPSTPPAPAVTGRLPEGLYFMTRMWASGSFEMGAWYFSGGQFAKEPNSLGGRFDFAEAERSSPGSTGTISLQGDQMTFQGPAYKSSQGRFEPKPGGCFYWAAGLFCPVNAPSGPQTYQGTFSGSLGSAAASSSMSLTLTRDGRYEMRRTGATQTSGMYAGSSNTEAGRYELQGTTLRLTPSAGGSPRVLLSFPYDDGSQGPAPRRLYVGGFMLKQQ